MSLSKYPEKLDMFQVKKDAKFDGDPDGDFVMAEDVNQLQDAVVAIENALGVKPQGSKVTVGERITLLEGSASLRAPSFLLYLGVPSKINDSETTLEAAGHFSKYDHVVLGNNVQDPNNSEYALTMEVIDFTRSSRDMKFYGYIDCGVNTRNLSIAEIQIAIQQWKDIDAVGIYCANFGFEDRVSRERQNQILDSIHQHGMKAILDADNPDELFSDLFHESMNPNWLEPHIQSGDIFHYSKWALDTASTPVYSTRVPQEIEKLIKLYDYRVKKGVQIFATTLIQTTTPKELAQQYYDYAHVASLVVSMDAFHPVVEGFGQGTNSAPTFDWVPIAGSWYSESPRIEYDEDGIVCTRETPFGRIILNTQDHTYSYEGIYIPYELLKISVNTIDGTLLKKGTVDDEKIKSYKGSRLIDSINQDASDKQIDIKKIMKMSYGDLGGAVSVDALKANVITAINANIGFATIGEAVIGDLSAEKIKAGTIDAGRITASVVEALNLYAKNMSADSATIGEAVIGNLSAEKITAGSIDAERISASVVDAINLSAQQADIKNLNAENITAGNIKAERIQAEVVNALNLYAQNMMADSARINSASIGDLTAGHIRGSVMEAINLRADNAVINSARIAELTAGHIEASVIQAVNANIGKAKIDEAVIGDLSATKITAGDIDADRIKSNVISAINLYAQNMTAESASLNQAVIKDLNATKITAGDIAADRIRTNVVEAINAYAKNMTAQSATIDVATIGSLNAKHMQANVIEAVNAFIGSATINAAKIGQLKAENIQAEIIKAINASIETAKIDQAQIGNLNANKITAGTIDAERIKSSVITAINGTFENIKIKAGQIDELTAGHIKAEVINAINANLTNATINAAKIGTLKAENIQAEVIKAINASIETATIEAAKIKALTADHISAVVMEAINAKITDATIDSAIIGRLTSDNMKSEVIEAVNSYTGLAVIGQAKIGDLDATKIKTGTIEAERLKASVVSAINASIDNLNATHAKIEAAAIGSLKADNIKAQIIEAVNASIETAKIGSAKIGALTADHIKASVITAINGTFENITIDAAKIGELSVNNMKAKVIDAIQLYAGSARIDQAKIGDLDANKIKTGSLSTELLTANVVKAINSELQTAKIDSAKIGSLKAENIQAEIIKAVNASLETASINSAKIGTLTANHIKGEVIKAINASIETAKIGAAQIEDLNASKITAGDINASRLVANVVSAINSDIQTARIDQAKIGDLNANKITAGDIAAERMTSNIVSAINAYAEKVQAGSALIDSAAIGVLQAKHMEVAVLSAINASVENIKINNAKIDNLTANHIKTAVIEAINANLGTAQIKEGVIEDLTAGKIKTGDLAADRMKANSIQAINANLTSATIDAAKIGKLTANHIQAEVIKAINASIETAKIGGAKIGTLEVESMKAGVISAINGTFESVKINAAKIGQMSVENLTASVIQAVNASIENVKIKNAAVEALTVDHIKAVVIDAINGRFGSATIDAAKIGVLEASNINAGAINSNHISTQGLNANVIKTGFLSGDRLQFGTITGDHILANSIGTEQLKVGQIDGKVIKADTIHGSKIIAGTLSASNLTAGSITSVEIAAKTIQTRNLASGAVDASVLRAGTVTAEHISTIGLDANQIEVFGNNGQVLIGDGFLKVDGLDVGVVQSDNLVGNGLFLTASSGFGYLRDNPSGEAVLGSQSKLEGAHQLWRIDTQTGDKLAIDTGGTKPVDVAIDSQYEYIYVSLQGEDKLTQIQVSQGTQATRTGATLNMGKGPGKMMYTGDKLMDMKHFFVLNTDPKDVNIPDSLTIVDAPPTSINETLYVHHMVPVGNTPYDLAVQMVMEPSDLAPGREVPHPGHKMFTYITLADQGDIAVLDMSHVNSMYWKVVRTIPIAAHATDNYHGGLDGRFGFTHVVGGDSSAQYSDKPMEMAMSHGHGGYATSDGSIRKYTPHGIGLSADTNHIYVTDYENGHLLIIDVNGEAPYNGLTGSRTTGNLGINPVPPGMGGSSGGGTGGNTGGGHDHSHMMMAGTSDDDMFSIQSGGHNHGGMDSSQPISVPGFSGVITQEEQTTRYVRYRIPIGDAPERVEVIGGKIFVTLEGGSSVAVIDEADVLHEINTDYEYYGPNFTEFTDMRDLPMWNVRKIEVGAKPTEMTVSPDEKYLYVTVNGQNQIAKIDIASEEILQRYQTGPNPKGLKISPDGLHIYVVNHGGSGNLSFVYPSGQYIGDAYLGLEGGVEYQGAEHWTPNRSDWVLDPDNQSRVRSASTVEFHVNEPFLNEGGFTRLSSYGVDPQWTTIEQDVFNVVNYSNGNNVAFGTEETLKRDASLVRFWPKEEWLKEYSVKNITLYAKNDEFLRRDAEDNRVFYPSKTWVDNPERPVILVGLAGDYVEISEGEYTITYGNGAKITFDTAIPGDQEVYSSSYYYSEIPDQSKYKVYFEGDTETSANGNTYGDSHITFVEGYLPTSCTIKADYTFKHNRWFKNHNGSVLLATENSSSENFYVQFEVDEFVPKFITIDNQQTEDFTYWPIEVPAVTNADYTGLQYSGTTNRAIGMNVTSSVAPKSGQLASIVDGVEPMNSSEEHMHMMSFSAMHEYGETVVFPGGLQSVTVDLGKTYMVTDLHISHCFHKNRKYHKTKTEVSQDGIHWTAVYDSAVSGEYMECEYMKGHDMTHYGKHLSIRHQPVRYIRDWSNGYTEWATSSPDVSTWNQDVLVGKFTDNHWTEIKAFGDWEFEKEFSRNYAAEMLDTNPRNAHPALKKGNLSVTGGSKAGNIGDDNEQDLLRLIDADLQPRRYFTAGKGAATVTVDLGSIQKVDTIRVFRYYADLRTHKGTKTEVSANGTTWTTVYDSKVHGEYEEHPGGKILSLGGVKDVRYIRDTATSWQATLKTGTVVTGDEIRWIGIHAYLGYDANYEYVYQEGSELAGQNLASNGQGVVTTDIAKAYAAVDIPIDFTSWWYMTYLVGPEFGQLDIEMPTVMGGSHSLFEDAPYLNKIAHRHIMSWPNSKNIKEDASQDIKAGLHRAIIRQKSGKVTIDRLRFEDYQYLYMNSTEIPKGNATNFMRYKIEPEVAKWYIGRGNQSTEGAYDERRINTDTGKPDGSVPIKYRFRVKTRLNPKGSREERGVAYATSAIFETGRLSSHWRMSQSQDSFPGNRIQRWDPNQPHKTGIQHDHLANGSVRGSKLMPFSVMDHHISPYAKIEESKINLKYPTHRHGRYENVTMPDGMVTSMWVDNKDVLDSIIGFENCDCGDEPGPCQCPDTCMCSDKGKSFVMARGDHKHDHRYVKLVGDNYVVGTMTLTGDLNVSGKVAGINLTELNGTMSSHVTDMVAHLTASEHTKLTNISLGANKTENSATNGNIKIDGAETIVYTHPSTAGNKHIPTGGATGNFLKYASSGTASWVNVTWGDVSGKPTEFAPPIATSSLLGGVKVGNGISVDAAGTITWSHPVGDGNLHVPSTGTTSNGKVLKAGATAGSIAWGQVQMTEVGGVVSASQHGQLAGGSLHAVANDTTAGFMSAEGYVKLSGIQAGANNYIHPSTHALDMITETSALKIMTAAERTKLSGIATGANNYVHPTGDGNQHVPSTGTANAGKVLKAGSTAGSISWSQVLWNEIADKPELFAPLMASTSTVGGVMIGDNLVIDANGRLSAQNSYSHPVGDGNKHVPADNGTNANKVLKATSTAGSPVWASISYSELSNVPASFAPSTHTHAMTEVSGLNAALNAKASLTGTNTFTGINSFIVNGTSLKVQPNSVVAANTVLFQVNNSKGNSLVTMGASATGETTGKVVINGDLEVTGSTVQKSTQDIQGDMNVSGNLKITGDTVLGENGSQLTTINGSLVLNGEATLGSTNKPVTTKGDLRVEGNLIPVGKYLEVGRFPVYGIGGDPQFETEVVGTFEEIVEHYNAFNTTGLSCLPPVSNGAVRYYKLMISYMSSGTADSVFRLTQGDGTTEIFSSALPAVNATKPNKSRTWMSAPFSTVHTGDVSFQAKKNSNGSLSIRYVEVVAVDYYS